MIVFRLLISSMRSRSFAIALLLFSLSVSIALFLAVNRLQNSAKDSFNASVSGVDMIVGARNSELPILLFSVFRLGAPQRDISMETYEDIKANKRIDWTVPIALGDSHRGYRVIGTTNDYFTKLKTADKSPLIFEQGQQFGDLFHVVLGSTVAKKLGYSLNEELVIAHGLASVGASDHDNLPFRVSGILAPTGTPIDQAVNVSLEAITAIHEGWIGGRQTFTAAADELRARENKPKSVTAVFIGLKSIVRLFQVQRDINSYPQEALTAVAPGIALSQLWQLIGVADQALKIIALLVLFSAIAGLVAAMAMSISVRRREMAIFRAMGASPVRIFSFMMIEAAIIALIACLVGWVIVQISMALISTYVATELGLWVKHIWITPMELAFFLIVILASCLATIIPALQLYRYSLRDGMTVQQ